MSVSKIAFNTLVSSGCLATLGATGWWLADTKYARQYRIKLFLQGKCDNFVLDGKMLILKEALVSDIETAVETKCGVKILYPNGFWKNDNCSICVEQSFE